jgi:colanic acid/amylovoran biosynthesis glycosyltransferase
MYRAADAVTAGSRFIAAKIAANGCAPEKIRILPVGVRMDEHPPLAFANRSARTILSVGRLVEVKGFRYGVEAFAAVRKEFPEAEYLIVGQGSGSAELLSLARELGVAEGLKLLGPQSGERVAELYGRASVFVLPSIRARDGAEEGQGLVLQEAQASGLPVVSTLVGGIPEGVREGETGFLVPQKDPDALADRIRRLLGDADLRERMGRSARAFAEGNYDMRVLSARLLGIYEAALAISS